MASPITSFAQLHRQGPVHRWHGSEQFKWLVIGYDAVYAALRDPRLQSIDQASCVRAAGRGGPIQGALDAMAGSLGRWLFFLEAPEHGQLRRPLEPPFTPRAIGQLRPQIESFVEQFLSQISPHAVFDFVECIATPLPALAMALLMGVPAHDAAAIGPQSRTLFRIFEQPLPTPEYPRLVGAAQYFEHYFRGWIDSPEAAGSALASTLRSLCQQTVAQGQVGAISLFTMLFSVGQDTLQTLLGNAMFMLLARREQAAVLAANPELLPGAARELTRLNAAVRLVGRVAMEPIELGGRTIPKGDQLIVSLAAANQDPNQFTDPGNLDFERTDKQNLTYGAGIHHCLGANLSRLVLEVVIEQVLRRGPSLACTPDKVKWRKTHVTPGVATLPMVFAR